MGVSNRRPHSDVNVFMTSVRKFKQDICGNLSEVARVQGKALLLAKHLLGAESERHNASNDMSFYDEYFGTLQMVIRNNKANPLSNSSMVKSLNYYRIFKCGNDNVRSLLYEAAHAITHQNLFFRIQCAAEECAHEDILRYSPTEQRNGSHFQHHPSGRLAFTFVRDPISRFISAINEIECRAQKFKWRQPLLPVSSSLGTHERLHEWIEFLVFNISGSQLELWKYEDIELSHLAPMVGTIVQGNRIEGRRFHVFHVEDFLQGWQRLSQLSNLPLLSDLAAKREKTGWDQHECSRDPHHIVSNYSQFFDPAYAGRGISAASEQNMKYIRSICALYLTDFVCGDYAIPSSCSDILAMAIENHSLRNY